jgi:phage shock protein A
MSMFRSIIRFITTLGGLLSSKVDEGTDALVSTPAGVKAAFREARDKWTRQYHEVRDAVSQLLMVMESKRQEMEKLKAEQGQLEVKKKGAVEKFKSTREDKFQVMFQEYHTRSAEVDRRIAELSTEITDLERQVGGYKLKLTEMQTQISNLDRKEAEAIADIVSSKQIVELNDRMMKLGTSLHDENLQAIDTTRQKMKAKAKLSDELAGTDKTAIEREVMAAGLSGEANDEFARMLAESELKSKERGETAGPQIDRTM